MDGVLADFVGGVLTTLRGLPADTPRDSIRWSFVKREEWEKMDGEFWEGLSPTPEAELIVQAVEDAFGPDNVCILTSPVTTPGCYEGKLAWLRRHFPAYSQRFLVGPMKQFCAAPNHVLVDDHDDNVGRFREAGGMSVLVPQPWNERRGKPLSLALEEIACYRPLPRCPKCQGTGWYQPAPNVRGMFRCDVCR
jgi:hypothetical protein